MRIFRDWTLVVTRFRRDDNSIFKLRILGYDILALFIIWYRSHAGRRQYIITLTIFGFEMEVSN